MASNKQKGMRANAANVKTVHVNDPTRRKAAKHDSVKKATKARLAQRAASMGEIVPGSPPRSAPKVRGTNPEGDKNNA